MYIRMCEYLKKKSDSLILSHYHKLIVTLLFIFLCTIGIFFLISYFINDNNLSKHFNFSMLSRIFF